MTHLPGRLLRLGLALELAVSIQVAAEQVPAQTFVDRVIVSEVLLDVLVTDSKGNVVIGLVADDFVVSENGQPVELTSVVFYSSRELMQPAEELEPTGLAIAEVLEDRYFILFFQQQRRASAEVPGLLARQVEAAREVETWIREVLQPRDLVAVVSYETRLDLVLDFSRHRASLIEAVTRAASGQFSTARWPSRSPAAAAGPSLGRDLPTGKELGRQSADVYGALQILARAAGTVQGRKNLVLLGRGIGDVSPSGVWQPDSRYWDPTVQALNDNNVAAYPLDLMPLGARHSLEQSLSLLANQTGGTFTRQFTSFGSRLRQISEENSGYYLLSYMSRHERGASGFQQVEVKTRNPQLRVRARRGYLYGE